MHGAGGRLDHDRGLVGQLVGHGVELARVGDHQASTSRRRCRSRSRSAGRARGRRRRCARSCRGRPRRRPGRRGRCRGSTQPSTGSSTTRSVPSVPSRSADHLVAGHERERHDRLEVARRACRRWWPGRCRRCRPGGAGRGPSRGRAASGGSTSRRRSGPTLAPPPGTTATGRPWPPRSAATLRSNTSAFIGGRPGCGRADQRRWPVRRACGGGRRSGSSSRGAPPGALVQVLDEPARACGRAAASRVSGLTATGKPTASSMGRSLAESA